MTLSTMPLLSCHKIYSVHRFASIVIWGSFILMLKDRIYQRNVLVRKNFKRQGAT
ncbi:hypothetical protein K443DRAFT_197240 [Laccaria amethystina LaAM-08-1]|uniref:Uncharacterized protein n=1 Tax=Laccaria amethystina LaAM-08-1 TaxID=1095629 RepID=A0A0C9X0N3_9AGAR|nr:hypothetical protein K443DRAFT_197240 [Laccaria amethystina LaAM-08-1]